MTLETNGDGDFEKNGFLAVKFRLWCIENPTKVWYFLSKRLWKNSFRGALFYNSIFEVLYKI
jgi:hypothetical protein